MRRSGILLFEFGAHYHVVPPLLLLYPSKRKIVFMDIKFVTSMKHTLKMYAIDGEVLDLRNSCLVLRQLLILRNSHIIVSTAREWVLSKQEMLQLFSIAILRPEIVCIRNPSRWRFSELRRLTKGVSPVKVFISILILRFLLFRAKNLIVESEAQKTYVEGFIPNTKNIIAFPGRLTDVIPQSLLSELDNPQIDKFAEDIVIGILGTIDESKRDYEIIARATKNLAEKYSVRVVFLGNTFSISSKDIVSYFTPRVKVVTPPLGSWDEFTLYTTSKKCHLLISPLKLNKSYGYMNGTGTVADAILANKFLFLPDYLDFGESYKSFIISYRNSNLSQVIEDFITSRESLTPSIKNQSSQWLKSQLR